MTLQENVSNAATAELERPAESRKTRVDAQNPWPGADAYDEAASAYFYGRDRESRELLRLIKLAPLTVVYGKSGLGKTSLLQAGLFPLLRDQHYLPVLKRLDFEQAGEAPLEQIKEALKQALEQSQIQYPPMDAGQSLWEYLHRKDAEFVNADGEAVIPVLVLDQFEELFSRTRGNDKVVQQVFFDLADLIENRIPSELTGREARERRSHLDILSQSYRIVLSFREDFIPIIRSWEKQVPSLLRNYLRLQPMSREQAIEAVNKAGAAVLEPDVAPDIVQLVCQGDQEKAASDTSDAAIEPVLLSLCCTQLNRRRGPGKRVDKQLVKDAGQDILESFYRSALADPAVQGEPDAAGFIENYLIQGDRFRGDYPRQEALDEGKLRPNQLAALTDKHRLLRIINRGDTPRIELIHDRLVPVVKKARDERHLQKEKAEQEEKARQAEQERDAAKNRSRELQRQRDRARLLGAVVAVACVACVGVLIWGVYQKNKQKKIRAAEQLAVDTSRLAEGRGALPGNSEPLDQAIHKALASYVLSGRNEMADTRDPSLTVMEKVLDSTRWLAKLVSLPKLKPTQAMRYSPPDGKLLAVGGEDGQVWILDAVSYKDTGRRLNCEQKTLPGYKGKDKYVAAVAFNREGTRLAAVYITHDPLAIPRPLVCVFDIENNKLVKRWLGEEGGYTGLLTVAYGGPPEREYLVFGGSNGILRRWDLSEKEPIAIGGASDLPNDQDEVPIVSVALNRDQSKLAVGKADGLIQIWNTADWGKPKILDTLDYKGTGVFPAAVTGVEFSPDPKNPSLLVSATDDGYVFVWNSEGKGCVVEKGSRLESSVDSVSINNRGVIAAGTGDGHVEFFRLDQHPTCANQKTPPTDPIPGVTFSGHGGMVLAVALHPTQQQSASVGVDGTIRFWARHAPSFALQQFGLCNDALLAVPPAPCSTEITAIAVSPDGTLIAGGDNHGSVYLWRGPKWQYRTWHSPKSCDAPPNEPDRQLFCLSQPPEGGGGRITGLVFASVPGTSGKQLLLVSAGTDGIVRRWRVNGAEGLEPVEEPVDKDELVDKREARSFEDAILSLALARDGRRLAAGTYKGTVRLWDVATGKMEREIKPFGSEPYPVNALGFSSDDRYLATGSNWDTRLRVVDLTTIQKQPPDQWCLKGHTSGISRIASGPEENQWLLTAEFTGGLLEWANVVKGKQPASGSCEKSESSEENAKRDDEFKFRLGTPELRPTNPVTAINVSSKGRFILTGGRDGQIQLWDGKDNVLISDAFGGHKFDISGVAFYGSDKPLNKDLTMITADLYTILVWPGPDTWHDILCQKLLWNMSDEQWKKWVSKDIDYKDQCENLPRLPPEKSEQVSRRQ